MKARTLLLLNAAALTCRALIVPNKFQASRKVSKISLGESPAVVQESGTSSSINGDATAGATRTNATTTATKEQQQQQQAKPEDDTVFDLIAGRTAVFILESDMKRNAVGIEEGAQAPSATKWIDDATAYALRQAVDMLKLQLPDERTGIDRDEASNWIRFFKAIPAPVIVDFSDEFRSVVNATLPQHRLDLLHKKKRSELLQRVGCRLILLPSGALLPSPLVEFPNSLIYGKLLYGGVTRSRLLPSSNSRATTRAAAGVRQAVKQGVNDQVPTWMMFGGASRMYQAADMGPAAVLEVIVQPQGELHHSSLGDNMVLAGLPWPPQKIFDYVVVKEKKLGQDNDNNDDAINTRGYSAASLSGRERNEAFRNEFTSAVGGLQPQIDAIVRRVLDGRVIRPADKIVTGNPQGDDETSRDLSMAAMEAEELALLGLTRKFERGVFKHCYTHVRLR